MGSNRVEAVERALEILGVFIGKGGKLTLKAISEETGMYKSTILRLMGSLEYYGYVRRGSDGRYSLGITAWRLGQATQAHFDISAVTRETLAELRDELNETASFYVREQDHRVCLFRESPLRSIVHSVEEGASLPLDKGAAGLVLLAFSEPENNPEKRFQDIRDQGWALSMGERDPEVAAIAVPVITSHNDELIGALAISGLIDHFTEAFREPAIKVLLQKARALSSKINNLSN